MEELHLDNIIQLNGISSSEKSTLARALQELMEQTYFHVDLDFFQNTWPPNFIMYSDGENPPGAGSLFAVLQDEALVEICIGPAGFCQMDGMFRAVAGIASACNNLIVEGAIYHPQFLRSAVRALQGFSVLFVGVRCPLQVVERWEEECGNRARGARRFHSFVHAHNIYDLELDISLASPRECAKNHQSCNPR